MFILSAPPAGPPAIASDQWLGLSLIWEGPDGSVWDLTDPDGGVLLDRRGVEGLVFPKITKYSSKSRAIPGKRQRGWRAESREVFWPIYLWSDRRSGSSAEWLKRNDAFLSTIHPSREGIWRVRAGSTERTLRLTGVFDDSESHTVDPAQHGWARYGIALEAGQPFWEGEKVSRGPWKADNPVAFFPGPPFNISSSATFGSATIPNPGDVEAWGVWTILGPLTAVQVGVGAAVITVPFNIPSGYMLQIDTDPRHATARYGTTPTGDAEFVGADYTAQLGLQPYAPVPPGESVPLQVAATGSGLISYAITPLHFRAF